MCWAPCPMCSPQALSSHLLSPSAPSFTPAHLKPPSIPLPHPSSSASGAPSPSGAPSSLVGSPPDPLTRHLLPHALFSYEELRWQHLASRSSQKRRATSSPSPPSSAAPPPFIVGCVVNERSPPPAPSRGRERGSRSWDYRHRFAESLWLPLALSVQWGAGGWGLRVPCFGPMGWWVWALCSPSPCCFLLLLRCTGVFKMLFRCSSGSSAACEHV